MNKNWIDITKQKPISGQDVLIYWWDEGVHQVHILSYFEKGDFFGPEDIDDALGLLDWVVKGEKGRQVDKTGFYMFKPNDKGFCRFHLHADLITHWMPIPMPPNNKLGDLGGIEVGVEE